MRLFKLYSLAMVLILGIASQSYAVTSTCLRFESFPLGQTYGVGDNHTHGNIYAEFISFQLGNGQWTNLGFAEIENGGLAHGSGQELELNNINLRFMFDEALPMAVTFKYADMGGNVNLGINGTLSNVGDLSDLNGAVINGVLVMVSRTEVLGGHYGTVALIGLNQGIELFAVGGQEFWVDDICAHYP